MDRLIRGIHSFQEEVFGSEKKLFERLAKGQQPETLFITCSDSRIDPSLLTQSKPGDLFILRNAGNIIPPHGSFPSGEAATIEFAIEGLGIQEIIVCGHTHCGAMKGLMHLDQLDRMAHVKNWLAYAEATRRIVEEKYGDLDEADLIKAAIRENVLVQIDNLRTHPVIAAAMASRGLKLHGWVYEIESGNVFAFDPEEKRFLSVHAAKNEGLAVTSLDKFSI